MTAHTTRRAFIGAMAALPAVAIIGQAQAQTPATSPEWRRLKAALPAAEARSTAFHDNTYRPACEAWRAACEALPHHTTVNSFENMAHEPRTFSTADEAAVAVARRHLANIDAGKISAGDTDWHRALRELIEAADEREAAKQRLREQFRISELGEESDRLATVGADILHELILFPVTSFAELIEKAELIDEYATEDLAQIIADLRRLAAQEGR